MRTVVTGAGGFIGWHLVDRLAQRGDIVQAWTRHGGPGDWDTVIEIAAVDVRNEVAMTRELARFTPDVVVHLAAQSLPGRSWEEPALTYEVNVIGTINLLEAVRRLAQPVRVLLAGSSAEYSEPLDGRPIHEDSPTEPNSPYATSKQSVDQLAQLYVRRYELDIVRFRPFHFAGPRKTGDVCSDFARRVVAIERGAENDMSVGSLQVARDIIDVRDGVDGIICIVDSGKSGEIYNVCCGSSISIGEILETYRRLATVPIDVIPDAGLTRPLEQKTKVGDSRKLRALGWKPRYSLDETLRAVLDYWRATSQYL